LEGHRPSYSAHVRWGEHPDFLYAYPSNGSVCGFLRGKPHEGRRAHQASQEIRAMGHPSREQGLAVAREFCRSL
jgi:hypothetical protein